MRDISRFHHLNLLPLHSLPLPPLRHHLRRYLAHHLLNLAVIAYLVFGVTNGCYKASTIQQNRCCLPEILPHPLHYQIMSDFL